MQITSTGVSASFNVPVDLSKFVVFGDRCKIYNHQVCLKIQDNITACIYRSGKLQIYGIKAIPEIPDIWNKLLKLVSRIIDVSNADEKPILKFIVAHDKLPFTVNLRKIQSTFPDENIEYEPEQFPGLIWKLNDGSALIFSTGSIVITGCNSELKICQNIEYISNILLNHYNP